MFDGRPRGEGYTHFKSAQGHSIGGSGARFWYPLIAGVPGSLLLYYVFHLDRAPFTNRIRMIDLSREKELSIGAANLANYRSLLVGHPVRSTAHHNRSKGKP